MSRSAFIKFTKSLSEDELRTELRDLYGKIVEVKKHYAMELGSEADRKKIFDRAKKDVTNLLYIRNKCRKRPRIAKIKTILKEIAKLSVFQHETADLYLHAAEQETAYLMRRPSTTQATFNNCRENYDKACSIINQFALHEDFKDRCRTIAQDAQSIYMLDEEIQEIYNQNFKS